MELDVEPVHQPQGFELVFGDLAGKATGDLVAELLDPFVDLDRQLDIGELRLKMSGCINACGHHHVGHIGILGVDRGGEEYYQITLGGNPAMDASIGAIVGPAFSSDDVVDAVETVVTTYVELRADGERFLDTYRRVGEEPFKQRLYPEKTDAAA